MSESVTEITHAKVGKIPVIYIGAGLAGMAAIYAWRMKSQTPVTDTTTQADASAGDQSSYQQPDFLANPPQVVQSNGPIPQPASVDTNDAWVRRGVEYLVSQGVAVSDASNALSAYVNGDSLSFDQGKLRDEAVHQFGLPPESVPTSLTLPYSGPASRQGTPPTTHHVMGKSDSTFAGLAFVYYGLSNADAVNYLKAANPGIREPFTVGQTINVPRWHNPKYFVATRLDHNLYDIARKNGQSPAEIQSLNPSMRFPVKVGTRVRVA